MAEELDREKRFPYEIVAKLGELGLMGIPFPEEYGGGGADTLSYAIAVEELARIDSSVAITMAAHTSLGTMPIHLWGTAEQKEEWLPRALPRRAAGRVRADRARGRIGRRQHAHHRAARGRRLGDQRHQAVHHQRGDRHLGLRDDHRRDRRLERAPRDLEHHRPERHARIRRPASPTGRWAGTPPTRGRCRSRTRACRSRTCSARRATASSSSCTSSTAGGSACRRWASGLAQGALDEALSYAKERKAFGQPIAKFQAIQAKLADMSAEIEAARLLTYKSAILKDRGQNFTLAAAQAKLKTGPACRARLGGGGADPRRLRLHRGVPGVPLLPRREDPHHRRGHRRGAADGDRPAAGC